MSLLFLSNQNTQIFVNHLEKNAWNPIERKRKRSNPVL